MGNKCPTEPFLAGMAACIPEPPVALGEEPDQGEEDMQRNRGLILSCRRSTPIESNLWILRMRFEPTKGEADSFQCTGKMDAAVLAD